MRNYDSFDSRNLTLFQNGLSPRTFFAPPWTLHAHWPKMNELEHKLTTVFAIQIRHNELSNWLTVFNNRIEQLTARCQYIYITRHTRTRAGASERAPSSFSLSYKLCTLCSSVPSTVRSTLTLLASTFHACWKRSSKVVWLNFHHEYLCFCFDFIV